jgi:peroxiredoxin Q/BCP
LESHAKFAAKFDLPFALLFDADGKVRASYGNPDASLPPLSRITYIIDAAGTVRHIVGAGASVEDHLAESLAWAKYLSVHSAGD